MQHTEVLSLSDKWEVASEMHGIEGEKPLRALNETLAEIVDDLLADF